MWYFMLFGTPLGFFSMMSELAPSPRAPSTTPDVPEGLAP
jgi:hypothetical protein